MNTQWQHLTALMRDPALQKLLQQLAIACEQSDKTTISDTLSTLEKQLQTRDCRGLAPLTERLHYLLDQQAGAEHILPLIPIAAAYLVLLQDQQIADHPLVIVGILNQYQSDIELPELHPEDWLVADTRPARVRPVRMPAIDIDEHQLASVFQVLLLRWLQKHDRSALRQLAQICRYLRSQSNRPEVMLFWQAAEAMVVALAETALAEPSQAQRLLGKLAGSIRKQTEKGEAALQEDFPERLLNQLLLAVAAADSKHSLVTDLQQTQQLYFIAHQSLLTQMLGWQSPSRDHAPEPANVEIDTGQQLAWLEQTDSALEQYHQHLHQWFKEPSDKHQQALLQVLTELSSQAEQHALPSIARLYQLMQQVIAVSDAQNDALTHLLEQAYQQLTQEIESLFENRPAPDPAAFEAMVEDYVSQQHTQYGEWSPESAFVIDADEQLYHIQSLLKQWQQTLPSAPPVTLAESFNNLSAQARAVQQHAIADLADSLTVLLSHHADDDQLQRVFELVDVGQHKLSEMQERLAHDLAVSPAREQLAAISEFIQQRRRQTTPARRQTATSSVGVKSQTLSLLQAHQRSSQQTLQTIANQHLLLSKQLRQFRQHQPALATEMQNTLTRAQSAVQQQLHSQALTQQTLASAGLQPLSVIASSLEKRLQRPGTDNTMLDFHAGDLQLPDFMVTPLNQALDNLLCQLVDVADSQTLTVHLRATNRHANLCLELSLADHADKLLTLPETETATAIMMLQSIGGRIHTSLNTVQLQLPRVEQPLRCLITRCGEHWFAIAAEAIASISHIDPAAFDHQPGQNMAYQHQDTICQLVSPEHPGSSAGQIISEGQPVVITRDQKQPVAITVDEVLSTRNCVFERLGPQFVSYPSLRGVSVMDGQLLMLLDTDALNVAEIETEPTTNV